MSAWEHVSAADLLRLAAVAEGAARARLRTALVRWTIGEVAIADVKALCYNRRKSEKVKMLQKLNPEKNLFVFDDVPELMKLNGRAVQIPEGFPFAGGWMIRSSPVSQDDPWKALTGAPPVTGQVEIVLGGPPKAGFIETHGNLPADSGDRKTWKDAHPAFIRAGVPQEHADAFDTGALLMVAEAECERWDFAPARPYVNKFGGFVRFPESEVIDFEVPIWTWLFDADQVGATYQMRWARKFKKSPIEWHPGVPELFRANIATH